MAGVLIPGLSLYMLQARPWSEWSFQWFFWLGCLCPASAGVQAWSEFRAIWWEHAYPPAWAILQRVLFIFTGAVAGIIFLAIALIQDHLRPRSLWPNKSIQRIGFAVIPRASIRWGTNHANFIDR